MTRVFISSDEYLTTQIASFIQRVDSKSFHNSKISILKRCVNNEHCTNITWKEDVCEKNRFKLSSVIFTKDNGEEINVFLSPTKAGITSCLIK